MTSTRNANRQPRSKRLALLGPTFAALALAGCNTTELVDKPTTWVGGLIKTGKWKQMDRSPLNEVEIVTIEHVVDYSATDTGLTDSARRRLVEFLHMSNVNAADRVTLHGPRRDFGSHDPVTSQRLEILQSELSRLGIFSAIPSADRIPPSDPEAVAMLVTRAVVIPPDCNQTPPARAARPEFVMGCANTANLGQMVFDPLDLKHGRQMEGADGEARALAIQRYREGEITELEESDTETTSE